MRVGHEACRSFFILHTQHGKIKFGSTDTYSGYFLIPVGSHEHDRSVGMTRLDPPMSVSPSSYPEMSA